MTHHAARPTRTMGAASKNRHRTRDELRNGGRNFYRGICLTTGGYASHKVEAEVVQVGYTSCVATLTRSDGRHLTMTGIDKIEKLSKQSGGVSLVQCSDVSCAQTGCALEGNM